MRNTMRVSLFLLGCAVMLPVEAGNPFKGKELYEHHCVNCHGARGESPMIGVPNFSRGESVVNNTDARLLETLRMGKGIMPGFQASLKDGEMLDIITYLRTLF